MPSESDTFFLAYWKQNFTRHWQTWLASLKIIYWPILFTIFTLMLSFEYFCTKQVFNIFAILCSKWGMSEVAYISQDPDSQEDPRLSGSSEHLFICPTHVRDSQEDPRLSGSSRHLRRIPDCQDPPDTSGGSRTVRILWTLVHMPTEVSDSQEDPGLLNFWPVPSGILTCIGNLGHVCSKCSPVCSSGQPNF